jgi:protein O-mannosyl-transferase
MTPRFSRSGVAWDVERARRGEKRRAGWLSLLAAAAAVLVVFAWMPALGAPYQFDDYNTPVGDAASQSLANWWHSLPRTLRPLTKLTYALESSLGAGSAPARRVLSALLLGGCVVLLKALLEAVAKAPAALALLVASVWAIHPAHAETVVALAGRPVLLSLLLMLGSALLLVRERPGLALGCALLALLARESALPWVVACAALAAHQRGISARRIAGGSAMAFGVGALVLASSTGVRALVESAFAAGGAWNRLGLQWAALTRGTFLLFANPAAFTPDMEFAPSGVARLGLIVATLALYGAAAWVALTQPRLRLFALLWLCIVLPTHSVVPKLDVLTARPFSASLAPLLGLVACELVARFGRAPRLEAGATLVLSGAFLALFPLTRHRAELYRDPIALWRDAAEATTHKVRPLVNLGTLLARQGELRAAESVLQRALERDPASVDIRRRQSLVRRALFLQLSPTGK